MIKYLNILYSFVLFLQNLWVDFTLSENIGHHQE